MSEGYQSPKNIVNYKFRELKVYSSTEWLADNKKKYRQVFDRYSTSYIYAELSFYNKQFDAEDWEVEIELKCYQLKSDKIELCSLPLKKKVISKYDNVVYIREGWGNKKEGKFWKKGTYFWEAWIDGSRVATKYFYIEDVEMANPEIANPYLEVKSLKLYEGPYDDVIQEERVYSKAFNAEETRYIYVEIILKNLNLHNSWYCELYTKFYNNARELKGQVVRLQRVELDEDTIKLTAGWGSNVKGSWREDKYTAEIVFMDAVVGIIPFNVGEQFEEGLVPVLMPDGFSPLVLDEEEDKLSFDELMVSLDELIGLREVKQKVRDHANYIKFLQLRENKGFEEAEDINVHSVFIGNPGTGKTTVASKMGKLYKKMGLLSKGHVHEVDRVDLVGEYIGQTAPKVKENIEKARGGVLFIDEAYALARSNDDSKDFGREVIEILLKEMSNGPGDLVVIVAGYPKEMAHFLDSNPGLKSRFKLYFEFSDYVPQELVEISKFACIEKEVVLEDEATVKIKQLIVDAYRSRDRTFGNARFVFDIIEEAKLNLGLRIMKSEHPANYSNEELARVTLADVQKIKIERKKIKPDIPVDEDLLNDALFELNSLIGIKNIKEQIAQMVVLVKFYFRSGKDVLNTFSMHTALVGNPGTGKTTVARILVKIYKALGILERGQMVETDRQGLVAGYVGQTAIKTSEKIEEALGGVLFIDEAYALTSSSGDNRGDFGSEAIQTILKRMEDHRGEFFVFAAGYTDNMEKFLKANPGLNSRFDKVLKFEDYSASELMEIAIFMFKEQKYVLDAAALMHMQNYFTYIYDHRDKYFGNARTVRNVVSETIKNQNIRLADLDDSNAMEDLLITLADVSKFKLDKSGFVFNKRGIGFGKK